MSWELLNKLNTLTVSEAIEIIEDAQCYGFEFKVENHRVFWREV